VVSVSGKVRSVDPHLLEFTDQPTGGHVIGPGDALRGNVTALFEAIDLMVEQQRILAALILIFAGIDAIASLDRRPGETSQAAFLRWADAFLLCGGQIPCTAKELYGARCGILHTFSADSTLSRRGEVRRVVYARGHSVSRGALDGVLRRQQRTDVVAIHLSDLQDAFRVGVSAFFIAVAEDDARLDAVLKKAGTWLIDVDHRLLDDSLDWIGEQGDTTPPPE
jgi:hypothetical protein